MYICIYFILYRSKWNLKGHHHANNGIATNGSSAAAAAENGRGGAPPPVEAFHPIDPVVVVLHHRTMGAIAGLDELDESTQGFFYFFLVFEKK
jgi:hypothetical protein